MLEVKGLTNAFGGLVAVNACDWLTNRDRSLGVWPKRRGKNHRFRHHRGFYNLKKSVIFDGRILRVRPDRICKLVSRAPFRSSNLFQNHRTGKYFGRAFNARE
jgi:ABC-type branched-subunit amino acid transport system ATPase component